MDPSHALAWLVTRELPAFWVAQALGLALAMALVARRVGGGAGLSTALGLALGACAGALLFGPLLRLPRALAGGASPFAPGFVMSWGALFGASLGVVLVGRARRARAGPLLDAAAPALGLLVALGRLGCLVSGCCHGRPAPWGLVYPPGTPAFDEHVRRGLVPPSALSSLGTVPMQALEAALGAALVCVGLRARRGGAFALVLGGYALGRLALEALRDDARPSFGPLSLAQWLSLAVLAAFASARAGQAARPTPR
jgi:phosphatidylglycerol:prolipoprotein diacylglycerol transferase